MNIMNSPSEIPYRASDYQPTITPSTGEETFVPRFGYTNEEYQDVMAREQEAAEIADMSAFGKGLAGGWESTKGLLGGAYGLAGDLIGSEEMTQDGLEYFEEQMAEASKYSTGVDSLADIESLGDLGIWMAKTGGELLPTMGASLLSGGIGGALASTVGKVALKQALKKGATSQAKRLLGKEILKQSINKGMTPAMVRKAAALGSKVGLVAGTTALEGGGNWGESASTYGADQTRPVQDLAFGMMSASMELAGVESSMLKSIFGRPVSKAARDTIKKTLLKEVGKGTLKEGAQEGLQELTAKLNANLYKYSDLRVTADDVQDLLDATAAGALGGIGGGAFTGANTAWKARSYETKLAELNELRKKTDPVVADKQLRSVDEALEMAETTSGLTPEQFAQAEAGLKQREQILSQLQFEIQEAKKLKNREGEERSAHLTNEYFQQIKDKVKEEKRLADHKESVVKDLKKKKDALLKARSESLMHNPMGAATEGAFSESKYAYVMDPKQAEKMQRNMVDRITQVVNRQTNFLQMTAQQYKRYIKDIDSLNMAYLTDEQIEDLRKLRAEHVKNRDALVKKHIQLHKQAEDTAADIAEMGTNLRPEFASQKIDLLNAVFTPEDEFISKMLDIEHKQKEIIAPEFISPKMLEEHIARSKGEKQATRRADSAVAKRRQPIDRRAFPHHDLYEYNILKEREDALELAREIAHDKKQEEREFYSNREPARSPEFNELERFNAVHTQNQMNDIATENKQLAIPERTTGEGQVPSTVFASREIAQEAANRNREAAFDRAMEPTKKQYKRLVKSERRSAAKNKNTPTGPITMFANKREEMFWDVHRTFQKQFPVLSDKVFFYETLSEIEGVNTDKLRKNTKAFFDTESGKIYIIRENIKDSVDLRKTLVHEAVAHFGLRQIMTKPELKEFLKLVFSKLQGTKKLTDLLTTNPYLKNSNKLDIAEEYVARLAEKNALGLLTKQDEKNIWTGFKALMKRILTKFKIIPTDEMILNTLRNASAFLQNRENRNYVWEAYNIPNTKKLKQSVITLDKHTKKVQKTLKALPFFKRWMHTAEESGNFIDWKFGDALMEVVSDPIAYIKKAEQAIRAKGGILNPSDSVYNVLSLGRAHVMRDLKHFDEQFVSGDEGLAGKLNAIIEAGLAEPKKAFEKASKVTLLLHAIERNQSKLRQSGGKVKNGSGISNEEIAKGLSELLGIRTAEEYMYILTNSDRPAKALFTDMPVQYQDFVNRVAELNNHMLDLKVKEGLVHKDQADVVKRAYDYYVPLKNIKAEVAEFAPGFNFDKAGVSKINQGTYESLQWALGRRDGSLEQIENPVVNSVLQAQLGFLLIEKNRANRKLVTLADEHKDAKTLWESVPEDQTSYTLHRTEEGRIIKKRKVVPQLSQYEPTQIVRAAFPDGTERVVIIKDKAYARAFAGSNVYTFNFIPTWLGKATANISKLHTTYAPPFLLTNPVKDLAQTLVNITSVAADREEYALPWTIVAPKILKAYKELGPELYRTIKDPNYKGKHSAIIKEYLESGAYTSGYGRTTADDLTKILGTKLGGARPRPSKGGPAKAKAAVNAIKNYMTVISDTTENIARLATYKVLKEEWIANGISEKDATVKAATSAQDITVNYTKRGAVAGAFAPLFSFFNASIQSTVRMLKTLEHASKDPKSAALITGGFILMPLALAALNREIGGEDEDGMSYYDKIPRWERQSNLIFMLPFSEGQYIKVPVAYGLNIFNVLADVMDQMGQGNTTAAEGAAQVGKSLFSNFSPLGEMDSGLSLFIPTVFRPLIAIQQNKSWSGGQIYPENPYDVSDTPDSSKMWSSTEFSSPFGVLMPLLNRLTFGNEIESGLIDISPETAKYLSAQWGGGPAKFLERAYKTIYLMTQGNPQGESVAKNVPVLRRFFSEIDNKNTQSTFYENRIKYLPYESKYDAMSKLTEEFSVKDRTNYKIKHRDELRIANRFKLADSKIKKINKLLRATPPINEVNILRREKLEAKKLATMKKVIHYTESLKEK